MGVVGRDVHRVSAEAVVRDRGALARLGRVGMTRDQPAAFARTPAPDDARVVIEATGSAAAVMGATGPHTSAAGR